VRAPTSPASPFGLRKRRPHLAAALAGGPLANAKRVRLCCGLRLGGGSRKPLKYLSERRAAKPLPNNA